MEPRKRTMTDEQRKQVALEYLKGFDNGGVTSSGRSILDLFAPDAQVYFPKWGLAKGREQIGKLFSDVGGTIKSIAHHDSEFNWIFSGGDLLVQLQRLCNNTASFRATATTARFLAFFPPRSLSRSP
jgi:hypothetical protein